MPRVRYSLMVKSLPGSPGPMPTTPNPAMQRHGTVPLDEGRQWAGDLYEEGPVTDLDEAFATFSLHDSPDVEAWLDRNDDGTLTGWVRDGADVYRYSDPETWALDVDGAQMDRTDDGATAAPDAAADTPDAQPAQEQQAGEDAFGQEPDPAAEEPDPTVAAAAETDPTAQPGDGDGHDTESTAADDQQDQEWDNPFAEVLDELDSEGDGETPGDSADDAEPDGDTDTAGSESAEDQGDPEDQADGGADEDEEDDAPDDKKKRKRKKLPPFQKKILGGRVQVKHLPGQHNQEDHGNWADDGIQSAAQSAIHAAKEAAAAARSEPSGGSGGGGSSSRPKGGSPAKATLKPEALKHLSDEDLAAITESGDLYDMDTMLNAAAEMDSRNDIDAMTRGFAGHTEPGSPERQALFDAVIPEHWATWAAMGAKGKKPKRDTKREQIKAAYDSFVSDQYARALDATNGYFYNNKKSRPRHRPFDEMAFFDGRANRAQVRKYGSEELLRFFADHPRMTYSDFAAEFYPSYAKAKAKVGSRYLSEFG